MDPRVLYIEKGLNSRYFIAYRPTWGRKIQFVFKDGSYDRSWRTLFGAKTKAQELAQELDYQLIVVKRKK